MADPRAWSEYNTVYDLPEFDAQCRTYVVATTQRTGSHYLAHLLGGLGSVGVPFEYLNAYRASLELAARGWPDTEASQVRLFEEIRRRRTGTTGWFGLKAHWHTWETMMLSHRVRELVRPRHFIYLSRDDTVAQAVSLAVAEQTGVWVDIRQPRPVPPRYSRAHIEDAHERISWERREWDRYFAEEHVDVLRLSYEQLLTDPDAAVEQVLLHLCGTTDRPAPRALPPMNPRADDLIHDWAKRYRSGQ